MLSGEIADRIRSTLGSRAGGWDARRGGTSAMSAAAHKAALTACRSEGRDRPGREDLLVIVLVLIDDPVRSERLNRPPAACRRERLVFDLACQEVRRVSGHPVDVPDLSDIACFAVDDQFGETAHA